MLDGLPDPEISVTVVAEFIEGSSVVEVEPFRVGESPGLEEELLAVLFSAAVEADCGSSISSVRIAFDNNAVFKHRSSSLFDLLYVSCSVSFLPQLLVFTQFLFLTRFHEIFGGFRQAGFIVPERKKGGRPAYSA